MIVSVASGKGGTGKTLVATSLALSLDNNAEKVELLDCDVEEPNAHIFLDLKLTKSWNVCVPVPEINELKCTHCGRCADVCAFNALAVLEKKVLVFPELCHGCGACSYLCPETAIVERDREIGVVEGGASGNMLFFQGKLTIGEMMAPPIIKETKRHIDKDRVVFIDVPPGTSCPVVEAISGSDFCLLVTEPTPFGLNDLALAVEVVRELQIPCGVVLNRSGTENSAVEDYCRQEDIPVLLKIPLDMEIARAYSRGIPLVRGIPSWREPFRQLFRDIRQRISDN